jgi:hypothetical protein
MRVEQICGWFAQDAPKGLWFVLVRVGLPLGKVGNLFVADTAHGVLCLLMNECLFII